MAGLQYHKRGRRASELSSQTEYFTAGRKRRLADNPSQGGNPAKRPKETIKHPNSRHYEYPPEFWDRLTKVPLIRSALRELNRRPWTQRTRPSPANGPTQDTVLCTSRELARFARHGGPDLRDLRGYPPAIRYQLADAMSPSSRSQVTQSANPPALSSSGTATTTSTTPYNRGFEQHLDDHSIHPIYRSRKPDLTDTIASLAAPRPSLSPSRFPESAFETFQDSNARAKDKDDVKTYVVPTIIGARRTDHPSAMSTVFGKLEALTDGTLAPANPDIYYGAYPEDLNRSIRDELAGHIIPSTMEDKPLAPNFFLQFKGPDGSVAVATRQSRYVGAIGSRGMHSLQNYGKEEPEYDGQAYTFSSTYLDGILKLYTHHVTAPTTEGGRSEYHMTQARAYAMTDTRETFVEGATAFRNARDLAKQHRDGFIQAANSEAAKRAAAAVQEDVPPILHELRDSVDSSAYIASQDADDELQQHISDDIALEDDGKVTPISHHPHSEDDSQETHQEFEAPGFDDPSFGSSFTSSFSTAKRPRPSPSPASSPKGSQFSKSWKPPNKARHGDESYMSTTGPMQPGPREHE